jgi:putative SOS response-associated peptidase YedK
VHKRFAKDFAERRCIEVVDGFYEWEKASTPLRTSAVSRRAGSAAAFERDPLYAYAVTGRALKAGFLNICGH